MNSFEKLIRTALARQDASSAQVRTQVYATARAALDKTMRDRSDLSAQAVAQGRRSLEAVIRQVEAEFAPARPAPTATAPAQSPPEPKPQASPTATAVSPEARSPLSGLSASRGPAPSQTPAPAPTIAQVSDTPVSSLAPGPSAPVRSVFGDAAPAAPAGGQQTRATPTAAARATTRNEPSFGGRAQSPPQPQAPLAAQTPQAASAGQPAAQTVPPSMPAPETKASSAEDAARSGRRERVRALRGPTRIYSYILSAALLIAFAVIAVWWVQENDLLSPVASRDGATANPPGTTASGAASTERVDERDWITLLQADQADKVIVNGGNSARLVDFGGDPLIEMTFAAERVAGGDFLIEIDEAILDQYAGQTVLFDIAMQGVSQTGDGDVALSVECDFAAMGDCGRKRYSVPLQPASMVFSVDLPNTQAGSAGLFRISGVGNSAQGGVIGLNSIRVTGDGF